MNNPRPAFTTIDDVLKQAQTLMDSLQKLAEYKHPLDVRKIKIRKVVTEDVHEESRQIKAGARTYFVDIDRTRDGKRYLKITESRIMGEGEKSQRERNSIAIFPEQAQEFGQVLSEMLSRIDQGTRPSYPNKTYSTKFTR